ncbi:hypothetical protein Oweho_3456 [Owenweeksia hongkongensis DSM 17368]|uniref:Uncharacterized protein n=1 Tax=Owenweeksia hongkongensis (strain DSM 17368 / CIP 108786 / JCM 12287 / NRRL B-23963 / UST20020801) TaxID=926562 RepID=G8R6E2_OWEHD|nr:hypothetical protein [Owenweeksia hongkongensis]AEV34405.1 hypothetical protein Oweho_3456 [Owenweeksia hongkongensis DSM 17368]
MRNVSLPWLLTILMGMIAAIIGLVLRFYFAWPFSLNFKYLLHAHSHAMLLGWLLGALVLLSYKMWNIEIPTSHKRIFYLMVICVLGMLLSFPFQGYAAVSITFTTLHLWLSYILLFKVARLSRNRGLAGKLVQTGVVFFFISSIGPYSLGPLMANYLQSSPWYDQAIFFYLHFLYNGAFFFFILAFIVEKFKVANMIKNQKAFYVFMLFGTLLTWFHKLDYSFDFWWINVLAGMGSIFQILAGVMLLHPIFVAKPSIHFRVILWVLLLKWIFQILGSFPMVASQAVNNRFVLIAYLHFIFLGIFTPLIWYALRKQISGFNKLMSTYCILFLLTELALVLPSLNLIAGFTLWPQITFILYLGFVVIWCVFGFKYLVSKAETPKTL